MMSEKFLCVMAGYDEKTEACLSGIQHKLHEQGFEGRETKGLPQHITLGTFPAFQETQIAETVQRIAARTKSFEITFNHIGLFAGAQVLFVAPDTNARLISLKENFGTSFNWTAHSTMLIDEMDRVMDALPIVMNSFSPFAGRVTTLYLYEFFPARHILTVGLGS